MSKEKKETILYRHFLACSSKKCGFKFSIECPEAQNTKIGFEKMRCPVCRSSIMLDSDMLGSSGKPSMGSQSKLNIEASKVALEMAMRQKKIDEERGENKMVLVTSTQKDRSKYCQLTEPIPEKAIKSIEKKLEGDESFQEAMEE